MLMYLNNLIVMYKNYVNYGKEGILLFELCIFYYIFYIRCIFKCILIIIDM